MCWFKKDNTKENKQLCPPLGGAFCGWDIPCGTKVSVGGRGDRNLSRMSHFHKISANKQATVTLNGNATFGFHSQMSASTTRDFLNPTRVNYNALLRLHLLN